MDTLLIFLVFILVIGLGFILSRPFAKMEESQEDIPIDEHPSQPHDTAESEEKAVPLENATQPNISTFCPKCGHQVMSTDKFCPHCGYRLQS
jgi:rubrerythrin